MDDPTAGDPTIDSCTLTEAAYLLGLSRERCMRLLLQGALMGHRVAGRWFVRRESVERMLRERGGRAYEPVPA